MNNAFLPKRRLSVLCCSALLGLLTFSAAQAGPLTIADSPLFLNGTAAPLNMLVMGRDHKLYYEAYNDHSDLDGDGTPDVGYKPDSITYFGYFDSKKCYTYDSSNGRFNPASTTSNKQCSGQWSGDWLNYVTTSRIDALRKVLYGGLRQANNDTASLTVLERSYIPQDAHTWGKSYESTAHDGYDITKYTPLSQPNANSSHLFANTTLLSDSNNYPRLRVLQNQKDNTGNPLKIWNWVSIERPVGNDQVVVGNNSSGSEIRQTVSGITDYYVRVKVCDVSVGLESNCRSYTNSSGTTTYKPTGLLQDYGEQDLMKFGLITGSYAKNTDGGVLRRAMGSIKTEINTDGTFNTGVTGIIQTLNRLKVTNFGGSYQYGCGWIVTGPITPGQCQMWGNPLAEMMYEGLRYFAGKKSPTSQYSVSFGAGEESQLSGGGLPVASWDDPYASAPSCAKPFETVISDINPSYDSDNLPGSAFGSFSGDMPSDLNVSALGQKIWDNEIGGSKTYYIGRSLSDSLDDKAPTPKTVTSFGNIRGLAPEEPTKEGSYYSASVAYWGATHDVNAATGSQKVSTFAVALASPLPRIEIPVNGTKITLVPFAKTVGGSVGGQNVSASSSGFQPTNQIVDFYIDTLTPTYGKFRVNYEDVEQGADHDMDAIAQYEYTVKADNTVDVTVTSQYAAGSLIQHMGYVISGTTHDGIYFEVRDMDTATSSDPDYYLDTPGGFAGTPPAPSSGPGSWSDGVALPLLHTRNFTAGTTGGADILKDPLWYAAKWGGFKDQDNNDLPNLPAEWDENGTGTPSNYFLVTNALTLGDQLSKAFNEILARVTSASSASVNSGSISSETRVYQAKFNSGDWTGQLLSFPVSSDGSLASVPEWDAATALPAATSRVVITTNTNSSAAVPFRWANIGSNRQAQLDPASDGLGQYRVDYLRGDASKETQNGGTFRKRLTKLGDIVDSSPIFVGKPPFLYQDTTYTTFRDTYENRIQMVYVGANDGMVHGFDARTGVERLAFIPTSVFRNLQELTKPNYVHKFFVDGTPSMADVKYGGTWHTVLAGGLNKGGQGIYMLDVTDPSTFSESNASNIYRWEFTDANDRDLGFTYSRPAIAQVRTSTGPKWVAIFGNGYNNTYDDTATGGQKSTTGNAVLYFVDVQTGTILRKIDTGVGMAQDPTGGSRPNGLSTPAVVDVNGDSVADYVFAGDIFGNMWKFDLTSTNPTSWSIAFGGAPLFVAKDSSGKNQPITSRPEVGRGPNGKGLIVLFGTGKFLEASDKTLSNLSTQTFYGLIDPNDGLSTAIADRSLLTSQQIIFEDMVDFGSGIKQPVRGTTQNAVANRGWYLDLLSGPPGVPPPSGFKGEMQVSDSILRNGRIIFSTIIPSTDPCAFGGNSWLMELDALSGGRLTYPPLDLNNDKKFDNQDYITLPDGTKIPVSGLQSSEGMIGKAGILSGKDAEYKYTSGTSGNIQTIRENPGPGDIGRQSWRQLR